QTDLQLLTGFLCGCTGIYRFFDQFNSSTTILDIDHSSSVPPQITRAFFSEPAGLRFLPELSLCD
ncbi:MAG: hypothetical protein KZQ63_19900, partial [Candidatus Thiodiazotropha sp. (ex Lucinoma aequizonata)]|nr:hypothetical protein [Candidatus Thiodiazotropha sp. (ex Lucinoma aequizonata)]